MRKNIECATSNKQTDQGKLLYDDIVTQIITHNIILFNNNYFLQIHSNL